MGENEVAEPDPCLSALALSPDARAEGYREPWPLLCPCVAPALTLHPSAPCCREKALFELLHPHPPCQHKWLSN